MSYKIVVDSCCELPKEYLNDPRFERVPLGLEVGDYHLLDDENFNQADFLRRVAECPTCPKSSCPSPERFMEAYNVDAEHIYVVTITAKLSGSYNSAELAKKLYKETYGEKKIHVVDSMSASAAETQIALKLMELEESGLPFEKVVEEIEKYRDELETYFVLDNLETLRKNGRLTGVKAIVATTLNIKPVMKAEEGEIAQKGQSIGIKKALAKMVDLLVSEVRDSEKKRVVISHCNAIAKVEAVKKLLDEKIKYKDLLVLDMAGLSSLYANDGGVIVTI